MPTSAAPAPSGPSRPPAPPTPPSPPPTSAAATPSARAAPPAGVGAGGAAAAWRSCAGRGWGVAMKVLAAPAALKAWAVPGRVLPGGRDMQRELSFAGIGGVGYSYGGARRIATPDEV